MPPAYEVLLLNTAIPQIQAAQSGDTYVVPRDIAFSAAALLANGTNSAPSLTFSSDTDTGIFRPATNQLGFATAGVQAMTLDASGRLGIGETNPAYKLHVSGTGSVSSRTFATDATGDASFFVGNNNGKLAGSLIYGSTKTAYGALLSDETAFYSNTSTTIMADGSGSAIKFATGGNTERARITSGGYFKASNNGTYLGSTGTYHEFYSTTDDEYVLRLRSTGSTLPYGIYINYSGASPNSTTSYFLDCSDSTAARAQIRSNGGLANYSANDVNLSDRREKTNFAPAKSYLDTICAIPVQTFNYIDQSEEDPGLTLGVVAQDVQAVAPELVTESNWGTKDDPKMRLSIYQTDLQYALMKCIQELKSELDSVKAELATLKGA